MKRCCRTNIHHPASFLTFASLLRSTNTCSPCPSLTGQLSQAAFQAVSIEEGVHKAPPQSRLHANASRGLNGRKIEEWAVPLPPKAQTPGGLWLGLNTLRFLIYTADHLSDRAPHSEQLQYIYLSSPHYATCTRPVGHISTQFMVDR